MNSGLWKNIIDFDLDYPLSEYGFSTRLEYENGWTIKFAKGAIIEYKKFMYLAATSEYMVSPSEIVDIVWHQHLIFTQSYEAFCAVLGKKIAHIPSTHNKSDAVKFKLAKERTQRLYAESFGTQPVEFWEFPGSYEPLMLKKSALTVWKLLSIGLLLFIPAVYAGYFLLRRLYIRIDSTPFLTGYIVLISCCFLGLGYYNRYRLKAIVSRFDKSAFLFNLSALELVYLKNNKIPDVIHGVVNNLVQTGKISIVSGQKLVIKDLSGIDTATGHCVIQTIGEEVSMDYPTLLSRLVSKPAFHKTALAMEGFIRYFGKSKDFISLFAFNFIVLAAVLLPGTVRIATGITRDKPIFMICLIIAIYLSYAIKHLSRLKTAIGSVTIQKFYRKNILPSSAAQDSWEWNYFLLGSAVFVSAFVPLPGFAQRDLDGGPGSSCSSGCASSCGGGDSGCGGCGGD